MRRRELMDERLSKLEKREMPKSGLAARSCSLSICAKPSLLPASNSALPVPVQPQKYLQPNSHPTFQLHNTSLQPQSLLLSTTSVKMSFGKLYGFKVSLQPSLSSPYFPFQAISKTDSQTHPTGQCPFYRSSSCRKGERSRYRAR